MRLSRASRYYFSYLAENCLSNHCGNCWRKSCSLLSSSQMTCGAVRSETIFSFFFSCIFFSCIAERAQGMVGQLTRNATAKKVNLELLAGSFPPENKQNKTHHSTTTTKPTKTNTKKTQTQPAGEKPRKNG